MLNTKIAPWPSFSDEEADAVADVVRSNRVNYWTGEITRAFETEFAAWSQSKHAIALANGTVALDLALAALGIGARNGGSEHDEVIVTPRTFLASVSSTVMAGATPVFADVDRDSGNISPETVADVLTERTRAIVPVHLAGWPCDLDPIIAQADKVDAVVIEDCAQAHGARYRGGRVGSIGKVGAWSFCQDKIMTTGGEGGMVTCDDEALWKRMWSFKDHGKSWDAVYNREHAPGFRWLHESFGTNWRMIEMQAAIGRIQLGRMEQWRARRAANAEALFASAAPFANESGPIRLPRLEDSSYSEGSMHAYYRLYAYVQPDNLAPGWSRDRIVEEIAGLGIPAMQGSCSEVYLEKAFDGTRFRPAERLPVARELGNTSIAMLVHPSMTEDDVARSGEALSKVLEKAAR